MPISIMLYISAFCKYIETYLNIGYNLVLSAKLPIKTAASQQLAAVLILYTYKNPYKLKGNPSPIQMRQYHEKSKGGKIIL